MTARREGAVKVLDIREQGPDMSYLDKLNRSNAQRLGLVDRVVVVDNTESLVGNHLLFQRLVSLSHVRAVICVAVGPIDHDGDTALRQSTAIGSAGITLWVGDELGSRWAGGTDRPTPVVDGPPGLADLLAVLRSHQVFDRVFEIVREVPHQAVCPGLDVVQPPFTAEELRFLRAEVLQEFVSHSTSDRAWPPSPASARGRDRPDPRRDAIAPESPLGRSALALRRAADDLASTSAALTRFSAMLLGRPRSDPRTTAAALDAHLARVDEMLGLLDRQTSGLDGAGPATRIGVPEVDPSNNPVLSRKLRDLVRAELASGRSLVDLSAHLRRMANQSVPGESAETRAELADLRAQVPREFDPPRVWPLPAAPLAVAAGVTCALAALVTSSSVVGGALGALWVVLIGLFVLRLPGRTSTALRLSDWLAIGAVAALAGGGVVGAARLPDPRLPTAAGALITGIAALLALAATAGSWRHAVTRWVRVVRPDLVRKTVTRVESAVDSKVRDHVRSVRHRARLSDAALLLASGTGELARVYTRHATGKRPPDQVRRHGATAELIDVLRSDLVSLSTRALDSYLYAIGTGSPLSADTVALNAAAERDLAAYQDFLDTNGIHATPDMIDGDEAREVLSQVLWHYSDVGARVLRGDGRGRLVQLCQTGDLRLLNVAWSDVRVLRFAPALVQRTVFGSVVVEDVTTTETDLTGVLRLVPLNPGRVVHEHPTSPDPEVPDGHQW